MIRELTPKTRDLYKPPTNIEMLLFGLWYRDQV